jgi:endonuclease-8
LERDDGWAFCWREPAKVHLSRRAFLSSYPPLARLGPDLVADGVSEDELWSEVVARLAAVEPQRLIGPVLLQQSVACGIGNVFKCEVLFLEGLNPWLRLGEVGQERALALYRRARPLLRANLRPGPRRTRQGSGPRGRLLPGEPGLWVYDRAGEPCLSCRHPIEVARQGSSQRPTYWCPSCQTGQSVRTYQRSVMSPAGGQESRKVNSSREKDETE